jgi:hypothetical protein
MFFKGIINTVINHNDSTLLMLDALRTFRRQHAPRAGNNIYTKHSFSWVQFFVYLWAFRLALSAVSVLIPGFSLMGSIMGRHRDASVSKIVPKDTLTSVPWMDFAAKLKDVRYAQMPALYSDVPLLPQGSVDYILKTGLPSVVKHAKRSSTSSVFTYYDHNRLWSKQYDFTDSAIETVSYNNDFDVSVMGPNSNQASCEDNNGQCQNPAIEKQGVYYYVSEGVDSPRANPFLTTLAPTVATIIDENVRIDNFPPSVMIWISSAGSQAHPHFDMEDNFFLQVSGTKTLTITHPSAYKLFTPFPILHPHWRQSQHSNLSNANDVGFAIETWNAHKLGLGSIGGDASKLRFIDSHASIELTLTPGQMLYIPAYYFHSTFSEQNSVSINIWTRSIPSKAKSKLSKVAMPFQPEDSTGAKLASLASSIRLIIAKLDEPLEEFLEDLRSRYKNIISRDDGNPVAGKVVSCQRQFAEATQEENLCTDVHHTIGGKNKCDTFICRAY